MRTEWKRCPRGDVQGQWASLYVTMNKRGFIVMTKRTFELMGSPEAVHLLFDPITSRIGVKGTAAAARDAKLSAKKRSEIAKKVAQARWRKKAS